MRGGFAPSLKISSPLSFPSQRLFEERGIQVEDSSSPSAEGLFEG
jgi:hypothetical protein